MHRHNPNRTAALELAGAAIALGLAPLAHADVTLTEKIAVKGTGLMSLASK